MIKNEVKVISEKELNNMKFFYSYNIMGVKNIIIDFKYLIIR